MNCFPFPDVSNKKIEQFLHEYGWQDYGEDTEEHEMPILVLCHTEVGIRFPEHQSHEHRGYVIQRQTFGEQIEHYHYQRQYAEGVGNYGFRLYFAVFRVEHPGQERDKKFAGKEICYHQRRKNSHGFDENQGKLSIVIVEKDSKNR